MLEILCCKNFFMKGDIPMSLTEVSNEAIVKRAVMLTKNAAEVGAKHLVLSEEFGEDLHFSDKLIDEIKSNFTNPIDGFKIDGDIASWN